MKQFFKKHIGLIILLIAILAFPSSLSTQARLNMRAVVTGLAIDKVDGKYEITAQIVKTSPSTESGGEKATVNFVSDTSETLLGAISKLSYKTGKSSGFSHTNFIIIGKEMLEDDLTSALDYFMRDNIINDSLLVILAEEKASDEIQKTKDIELSIAIGLQKVFLYKEKEGDGVMVTLLEFMEDAKSMSKTSVASTMTLKTNEEKSEDNPLGSSQSGSSSSSDENSSSSSGTSSSNSGGEQGGGSKYEYFESQTAIGCFVGGKYVGKLEKDETLGYMLANKNSTIDDVIVQNIDDEELKDSMVGIKLKKKTNKKRVRYENEIPCLDLVVKIRSASITEIQNDKLVGIPTNEQFEKIKLGLKDEISKDVSKCFEKAKSLKADIFEAYELAYKYHYNKTTKYYKSMEEFISKLKINVEVEIDKLEY